MISKLIIKPSLSNKIIENSHGEITSHLIKNNSFYKKYDENGLFSESIFGSEGFYKCSCGKLDGRRFNGKKCDVCHTLVCSGKQRAEWFAHLRLSTKIINPLYFNVLYLLLKIITEISKEDIYDILNYNKALTLIYHPVNKKNNLFVYKVYNIPDDNLFMFDKKSLLNDFSLNVETLIGSGTEVIEFIFNNFNLNDVFDVLKKKYLTTESEITKDKLSKQIKNIKRLLNYYNKLNSYDWVFIDNLPVIPPKLRPIIEINKNDSGNELRSKFKEKYYNYFNKECIRNLIKMTENKKHSIIFNIKTKESEKLIECNDSLVVIKFINNNYGPKYISLLKKRNKTSNINTSSIEYDEIFCEEINCLDETNFLIEKTRRKEKMSKSKITFLGDYNLQYQEIIKINSSIKDLQSSISAETREFYKLKGELQKNVNGLFVGYKKSKSRFKINEIVPGTKSIVENLKGKLGLLRFNLLGKKAEYSARCVIVVDPYLKMNQVGLPINIAKVIFRPFVDKEISNYLLRKNGFFEDIKDMIRNLKSNKANKDDIKKYLLRLMSDYKLETFNFKDISRTLRSKMLNKKFEISKVTKSHDEIIEMILNEKEIKLIDEKSLYKLVRDVFKKITSKLILQNDDLVINVLDKLVKNKVLLLNRQPTIHKYNIQAFYPVLTVSNAISIHPLICPAFGADIDGDHMTIHLPIGSKSQDEAKKLLISSKQILSSKNGSVLPLPSQDIVLGCYYLTYKENDNQIKKKLYSKKEVILAQLLGFINLYDRIVLQKNVITTPGKIIFNSILPENYEFVNFPIDKKKLSGIIKDLNDKYGNERTNKFLDDVKALGYKYATKSGISIGLDDLIDVSHKTNIINRNKFKIKQVLQENILLIKNELPNNYEDMTIDEQIFWIRKHIISIISEKNNNKVEKNHVDTFNKINKEIYDIFEYDKKELIGNIKDEFDKSSNSENSLKLMLNSGARGTEEQLFQMLGSKGLVKKKVILKNDSKNYELQPIYSNFRNGLDVHEYFSSINSSRNSLADKYLRIADIGYFFRRLIFAIQDVYIKNQDCGTQEGLHLHTLKENDGSLTFKNRLIGRCLAKDLLNPDNKELICKAGTIINEEIVDIICNEGINDIKVRSPIFCKTENGICQKCYGLELSTNQIVEIGTPVGIIAAQSINEPCQQLSFTTFHTGGAISSKNIENMFSVLEGTFETVEKYLKMIFPEVMKLDSTKTKREIFKKDLIFETYKRNEIGIKILNFIQILFIRAGIFISDKHIEIVINEMLKFSKVVDSNDPDIFRGDIISSLKINEVLENEEESKNFKTKPILLGISQIAKYRKGVLHDLTMENIYEGLERAIFDTQEDDFNTVSSKIMSGRKI